MADSRKDLSSAKQRWVAGSLADFGLPSEEGGTESGFVVYSCLRTRQGIRTEPVPLAEALPFDENTAVTGFVNVRESVTCRLEAPFEKQSKAEKVLPTLLDIRLPFPVEECVYVFTGYRQEDEGTSALGVAARNLDIEARLDALTDAGIDPLIIDHEGLALWTQSIIERPDTDDRHIRAVVQMGFRNWTLVLGNGSAYLGSYNIRPYDLAHVRRILKATVAMLKKSGRLDQISAGLPVDPETSVPVKILLCGWGAGRQEDVERFTRESGVDGASVEVLDQPETFLVRGLAQRSFEEGPLRCNLRQGEFEHPAVAEKVVARAWAAGAVTVLAGALLCGANIAVSRLAAERESAMDSKLMSMRNELAGYSIDTLKGIDAQKKVRSETMDRMLKLEPFLRMKRRASLRPVLHAVTELASEKDLEYQLLTIAEDSVQIEGVAPSIAAVRSLREYLESKGYQAELREKAADLEGDRFGFILNDYGERR
ncbi:MAG: hypothetical protein ACOC6C_04365 [Verrucomicrobiota bacterium]